MNPETIAIAGVLISIIAAAWMSLTGFAVRTTLAGINAKQADLEAKLVKSDALLERLAERLRLDEQETTRLQGAIPLLEAKIANISHDVGSLQQTQVTRTEWERGMNHLSNQMEEIKRKLERGQTPASGGRYGGGSGDSGPFAPPAQKR